MKPSRIIIDGTRHQQRCRIIINDIELYLSDKLFKYIALMAIQTKINDGYVSLHEFEDNTQNTNRYMYRLKEQIWLQSRELKEWKPYINKREIGYKLNVNSDTELIISDKVAGFPDFKVIEYYDKYKNHIVL